MGLKDKYINAPVLIVGNLEQNEAVLQLYSRFLTNADSLTPGKNGILIQFIPNRNSPGSHALIVAGSDNTGTAKAIDFLLGKINGSEKCDWEKFSTFELDGKAKQMADAIKSQTKYMKSMGGHLKNLYPLAQEYEMSKDSRILESVMKYLEEVPDDLWQADGQDNHYGMGLPVRGWDCMARSGKLPPELVQKIDQIFLNYLVTWKDAWWRRKENTPVFIDNRHHVYGTWGYWQTAKMLFNGMTPKQRKSREGKFLQEKCLECESWFKACRDNYQQPVLSKGVFINYTMFLLSAFQTGELQIFKSKAAMQIALLAAGTNDNTGSSIGISGYEDSYPGSADSPYPTGAVICLVNFFCRNTQLQWLKNNLNGFTTSTWWDLSTENHSYSIDLKGEKAVSYMGFIPIFGTESTPFFVSFRNGFKKDDLYLFITGNGTANINTGDSGKDRQVYPNMIARMSWMGTSWLIQNTNHKTAFHRNALLVDSSTSPTKINSDMKILLNGKADSLYFFSGLADNYMNSEWIRSYIILDNQVMIVEDSVKAKNTGDYSAIITWRSPCDIIAGTNSGEIILRDNENSLHILPVSKFDIRTEWEKLHENEGALKPAVIRQYLSGKLKKNESMKIFNLFFPASNKNPSNYSIKYLEGDSCLLKDNKTGEISIAGFGNFKNEDLQVDAKAFFLNAKHFAAMSGGKYKVSDNKKLDSVLNMLWEAKNRTAELSQNKSVQNCKIIWTFNGFDKIWDRLTDFEYSSETAKNLHFAFDGSIDRDRVASSPQNKAFEVSIDFKKDELLKSIEILSKSNGGKTEVEKAIPQKATEINIYSEDGKSPVKIDLETEVFWMLDESYKAETYTYTGAKAFLNAKGRKFKISTEVPGVYMLNLRGGKESFPEIREIDLIKLKQGSGILIRSSSNELACLDAKTGILIWKKKYPEIIDWAVGDADGDGFDEFAIACRDKFIRRINPLNGRELWACSTWPIQCGLPYKIDIYKGRENKGFVFSSYYHINVVGLNGKLYCPEQKVLPGMWLYNVMGGDIDLNGDGCADAISRALWGHVNLYDGKTGKVDYFANLRGRLVSWKIIEGKDKKPDLLIVVKDGIGLYDAHIRNELLHEGFVGAPDEDALLVEKRSHREIWVNRFESTATAFAEYGNEFLVGHASGFISRYSHDGKFMGKVFAGKTVKTMDVLKKGKKEFLLINTGDALVLLDPKLEETERFRAAVKKLHFLPGNIIVAVMPDNTVIRIELDK